MTSKKADNYLDNLTAISVSLQRQAWRLNIDIPHSWWENDDDLLSEQGLSPDHLSVVRRTWLTDEGRERLKFRIQEAQGKFEDARLERRQKRLAFYQVIFSMLFGLTGWILGLYALFTRK